MTVTVALINVGNSDVDEIAVRQVGQKWQENLRRGEHVYIQEGTAYRFETFKQGSSQDGPLVNHVPRAVPVDGPGQQFLDGMDPEKMHPHIHKAAELIAAAINLVGDTPVLGRHDIADDIMYSLLSARLNLQRYGRREKTK